MPTTPTHSEKELLYNIAAGDHYSFGELVKIHWPQVYGTALRLTRSPEQARDLAQEMFLKLWNNRSQLAEVNNIGTYIYVSARHLVLDYLRKKVLITINLPDLADQFEPTAAGDPQLLLEDKERAAVLSRAVQSLPEKLRQVFELHRTEGKTHREIATLLNISEVSSKTYIVRALKGIRQYLADHAPDTLLLLLILSGGTD